MLAPAEHRTLIEHMTSDRKLTASNLKELRDLNDCGTLIGISASGFRQDSNKIYLHPRLKRECVRVSEREPGKERDRERAVSSLGGGWGAGVEVIFTRLAT